MFNINKIKDEISIYVDTLGYSKEIGSKFNDMYIKEMEHLIDMHNRNSKLKPFKRMFLGREFNSENYILLDDNDLFVKSIVNVNNVVSKINTKYFGFPTC